MAMVGCGKALDLNALWEVRHVFPYLENMVSKYPKKFTGSPVVDSLELDEAVTEIKDDEEAS